MAHSTKYLRFLRSRLRELGNAGVLEPGQMQEALAAYKAIRHAIAMRDKRAAEKAAAMFARAFTRARIAE